MRPLGLGPGNWYRAPAPGIRHPASIDGPVLGTASGEGSLPLKVDLVGTPWSVDVGIDWNPAQLDRGTHLEKLNLHYMEYLRDLRPTEATRLMLDWARSVPPFLPGYWKDTWNSYALSIRAVVWIDLLAAHGAGMEARDRAEIDQSLAAQLRFLSSNLETDIGGNHLMKNLRALLRGGAYFEGDEATAWAGKASVILARELREQVLPDGMHFELSPSYHLQVMEDLIDMRRAVAACESRAAQAVRPLLDDALLRMSRVARLLTHPDGMPSLFADGGLHMAASPAAVLDAAGALGIDAGRPAGTGPWRLPDGGYCGLRSAGALVVVDCGEVGARHLPAHGHGDALAIEWSVRGRRILVDPGVFEYHAGPRRDWARSTIAHNTVTVDDMDQSEFWSAFRVARRAHVKVIEWTPGRDGFRLVAEHDGYRRLDGRPVHRRSIEACADRLTVEDQVLGGSGQTVRCRLLLAPWIRVESVERRTDGGWVVRMSAGTPENALDAGCQSVTLESDASVAAVPASWCPDFGTTVPTTALVMEAGCAPCRMRWQIRAG